MFNLWNLSVRDIYNLPRLAWMFIVENLLSIHHGFKTDLLSHYQKKFKSLLNCNATPVRILANMLRSDLHSVTGWNLDMIMMTARIDPLVISRSALIDRLRVRRKIPDREEWILEVVSQLLEERDASEGVEDREEIEQMMNVITIA